MRGEALNTFESSAWGHLDDFRAVAIGRRDRPVPALAIPAVYLRSVGQWRGSHRLQRSLGRVRPDADVDMLIGLERALAGASLVHAAETAIPWSHQAGRIAQRTGRPLVLTCWETIPFLHESNARLSARKDYLRRAAAHFVATTARAKNALIEERVDADRITVIPPGVDTTAYGATEPRTSSRLRVLVPARIIPEKGGTEAVRAWSRLPRRLRDQSELVFVGEGGDRPRLERAAAALGVAGSVRFLGSVPHHDMPQLFTDAAAVLLPSLTTPYWEEQFGMVLAEAMASGRAIIATDSGAIPEVLGDAGLMVQPYVVDALTAALHDVLDDERLRADLGARGRARCLAEFDAVDVGRRLNTLYRDLLP